MALKFGPSSVSPSKPTFSNLGKGEVKTVRVKDIVLSPNHPRFDEVGGWIGLGTIFFDSTDNPGLYSSRGTSTFAKPYFSNSKFYPLINELVAIVNSPDPITSQETQSGNKIFYYFPPVNSWNSSHHNALPDASVPNPLSKRKSYKEVENGSPNREATKPTSILLGTTFEEKSNVHPLYPYEGDHILEGRWGNSIRLGSTVNFPDFPNPWSSEGNSGDPIIIIKNGEIRRNQAGWLPVVEDIGSDLSSIYLTSTQKIPFFPSSFLTDSFGEGDTSLTTPSEYQDNQILVNSGRIVLNSNKDGIILSSPEVIHLSTGESIHMDCAQNIVLASSKVFLTSRNAEERAVLGDALVLELRKLLPALKGLAMACGVASAGPYPIPVLINAGPTLETAVNDLQAVLNSPSPKILSNKVKLQ